MPRRITIVMPELEKQALDADAEKEMRSPREHARFLIREALCERGLLLPGEGCNKPTSEEARYEFATTS